jgi:hypothetical protein
MWHKGDTRIPLAATARFKMSDGYEAAAHDRAM